MKDAFRHYLLHLIACETSPEGRGVAGALMAASEPGDLNKRKHGTLNKDQSSASSPPLACDRASRMARGRNLSAANTPGVKNVPPTT